MMSRLRRIAHTVPLALDAWASRYLRRPPRRLPVLISYVTNECNLRCPMCSIWKRDEPKGHKDEMSGEEWRAVVRSAERLGTSLLVISGGEPLLKEGIFDIIREASGRGISVHLCSNGTTLTPENVDGLWEAGLDSISVSLDGWEAEIHDAIRGPGVFDKAVRGVLRLRERAPDIRIGINFVINKRNFRDMFRMVSFSESLGVAQLKPAPIHSNLQHKDKRPETYDELTFREGDLVELRVELRKLARALSRSPLSSTPLSFLAGTPDLYSKPRRFTCFAGYAVCSINPFGFVAPCADMEGTVSVRDEALESILRGDAFEELRRAVRRCERPCWDTANTVLSLRLGIRSLMRDFMRNWRDLDYYFGRSGG